MGITRRFREQHIFQPDTLFSPSPFFSNARATPPRPPPVSLSPAASNLLCLPASANSRHKAIPRCSSCVPRDYQPARFVPRLAYRDTCFRRPPRGKNVGGKGHAQSLFDTFSRRFAWQRIRNEFAKRHSFFDYFFFFFFFFVRERRRGGISFSSRGMDESWGSEEVWK